MFREHWRELAFWRWWWSNRASNVVRVGAGVLLLGLILGAGLLAADRLSAAKGGVDSAAVQTYVETVNRVTTVHENGKVVRKLVPVVRKVRVVSQPRTVLQTQTSFRTLEITTKGKVQTIRQKVVKRVPVVRTRFVSVSGETRTVAVIQYKPTTAIETRTQTVTNGQTVTNSQTVTNTQTETQTVTQTVTNTETVTNTDTVTVPVTVTVTTTGP